MPDPARIESPVDSRPIDEWGSSTSIEAELPRRIISAAALLAALGAVAFTVVYLVTGPLEFIVPNLLAAAGFLAVGLARRFNADLRMAAAATIANLLFAYQLALVGRIDNGISVWFCVPVFAVMVLGLRRTAIYCTASAALVLLAVVGAARAGWLVPSVTIPASDFVMAASVIGVLLLCSLFAYLTVRARLRLAHEVDERTAALAVALAEARVARAQALEAAQAKDAFFANLTHEIRTPLTGIAGSAELLADSELTVEQRSLADGLLASTRNLTALVNAMLDHARLAAGRGSPDLAPMDPRDLARDLASLFGPRAEGRSLAYDVAVADGVPATVETDAIRLRQVISNLIANALKFTLVGSVHVVIAWEPGVDGRSGTLIATVADTGPGIARDQAQRVFEPFVQGDASIRRAHGGTGLGLAISRQLAELLGGTVDLTSELGVGSTFTVRVPATVPTPVAAGPGPSTGLRGNSHEPGAAVTIDEATGDGLAPAPKPRNSPLAGLRVLLAEDNEVNRMVATAMLRRSGVEVLPATDGHQAIALVASTGVDLVLMDLQMPGLDGIEATRRIRASEGGGRRRLPILAMTGNAVEDYGEACEAAGMDGFITKPISAEDLRTVLERTAPAD